MVWDLCASEKKANGLMHFRLQWNAKNWCHCWLRFERSLPFVALQSQCMQIQQQIVVTTPLECRLWCWCTEFNLPPANRRTSIINSIVCATTWLDRTGKSTRKNDYHLTRSTIHSSSESVSTKTSACKFMLVYALMLVPFSQRLTFTQFSCEKNCYAHLFIHVKTKIVAFLLLRLDDAFKNNNWRDTNILIFP